MRRSAGTVKPCLRGIAMSRRLLFWLLAAATAAVYLTLVLGFGDRVHAGSGGLPVFDLRMNGYTLDEAKAFLSVLTPEAKAIYLGPVAWLDTIFPGLLAATLYVALLGLLQPWLGNGARFAALVPVIPTVLDWLENAAVARMLEAGTDGVTAEMVAAASRWTVLKWYAYLIVLGLTLLLALTAWWSRRKSRVAAPS